MGRRAHPDHPLRPQVPQPEPDQELLAELCRLPPLPEDQGRKITKFQFLKFRNLVNTYLVNIYFSNKSWEKNKILVRVRSTSRVSSSRRTSPQSAPTPGWRSGTFRGRRC